MNFGRIFLVLVIVGMIGVVAYLMQPQARNDLPPYWSTQGWRKAEPSEAGLKTEVLSRMRDDIKSSGRLTQSCLVVKDGYVVIEDYFNGFARGEKHQLYSCTKSVVGTLIGIAVGEGKIKGVNEKLPDLLPKEAMEPWMAEVTLENLLTMSAGLPGDDWLYNFEGLNEMLAASDPLQYALSRPKIFEPGIRFEYTDAVSHMLSCIITEKTGMSAAAYAKEKLFKPLGITDYEWDVDPQGRNWGYANLKLQPIDMAKIGYLYLKSGVWEEKQVVPSNWVQEATKHRLDANLLDGYGYQWWIDDDGWYTALGYKGQFIMVFPKHNMVAVLTGFTPDTFDYNLRLAERFIIPST